MHGDNILDWLAIVDVEHLLAQAGVDIIQLRDVDRSIVLTPSAA